MKFCGQCGTQMDDDALFCPSCGTRQEPVEAMAGYTESSTEGSKAPVYIACAALALVLTVAFIIIGTSLIGSYKSPIRNAGKAFNSRSDNIGDYFSALPKLYTDIYKDGMKLAAEINEGLTENAKDKIENILEDRYEDIEDYYGKNAKLTYDITNKEKMDSNELSEIEEFYVSIGELIDKYSLDDEDTYSEMSYGLISKEKRKKIAAFAGDTMKKLKKVKVTDGYILTLDIKIKGKKKEDKEEDVEVCVVKMDGKWCIEPIATYTHYIGNIELKDIIDDLPYLDIFDQWD